MKDIAGAQILNARDLQQISATTAGKAVQRYPLYCKLDVPAGGGSVTELPFFSTPQGGTQTVGGTALTMDRTRTNITKANAISTPNDFILKAIRLIVRADEGTFAGAETDIADSHLVLSAGYFKLVFGEREHMLIAPPMILSGGCGLQGFGGSDIIDVQNSHPLIFKVEPWVLIPSELNFQATLNYTTALANTKKLSVTCIFDGDMIRNVS
jgi:hypothetical protein